MIDVGIPMMSGLGAGDLNSQTKGSILQKLPEYRYLHSISIIIHVLEHEQTPHSRPLSRLKHFIRIGSHVGSRLSSTNYY